MRNSATVFNNIAALRVKVVPRGCLKSSASSVEKSFHTVLRVLPSVLARDSAGDASERPARRDSAGGVSVKSLCRNPDCPVLNTSFVRQSMQICGKGARKKRMPVSYVTKLFVGLPPGQKEILFCTVPWHAALRTPRGG